MAGITDEGFVTKTFPQLLEEMRNRARILFADKVEAGDVVDVSDSSLLGRFINLDITGDADLWQLAQQCWLAFDPNSATGVSLDNVVAYSGIARMGETYSTVPLLFKGDIGTFITDGSQVKSDLTGESFSVVGGSAIALSSATGVVLSVSAVADATPYTVTYTDTSSTSTINYTSGGGATAASILAGIAGVITASHPSLASTIVGTTLEIRRVDVFQSVSWGYSANLAITKAFVVGDGRAVNVGPIEQEANTVTTITTPILGWDTVTNPTSATVGRLTETDEELRLRFRNSKFERSTNLIDSLYSALIGVEGVTQVKIYENDTNITDGNGVPPHSFLPIVLGGSSVEIAQAIWENKPIGILSDGNTTVSVEDIQGFNHDISFERPNPEVIYIDMTLTTDSSFPANGADLIKQAIITYATANFGIGDDVIYSRLFTPINSVVGHQVDSLTIGTTPAPVGTSNLVIAFSNIANMSSSNINITV